MDDLAARKAAMREAAYAARRTAREAAGPAPEAATEGLTTEILVAGASIVSGFLPIRTEIDPRPAMTALAARGLRVCVPVIAATAAPLRFREWRPDCALIPGPFGAAVPAEGDWLTPDALIAPLLAFDRGRWRLGYGGGFYDRTLTALRAAGPARAVGFAYGAQEVAEVPRGPFDVPLDAVVTEAGRL